MAFSDVLEACESYDEKCLDAAKKLLDSVCKDPSMCSVPQKESNKANYEWIEKLLNSGVPDGRHRLILYVISRYLVNVKGLSERDASDEISDFLSRSCKNFGNCTKVYESWIRNVVTKVKAGGWKPWTLTKIKERDPDLYDIIIKAIGAGGK
mgnify:CR=1 FL=1